MNNTWFTADTHFSHTNILGFEEKQRPFHTVEEMNETLIQRWNEVVKPMDTIYHLGDFCFGKHNISIADRLNGKKRLIMGNHDNYDAAEYLLYFEKLAGAKDWNKCILTHVPVHPSNLGTRFLLNIHGHTHSRRIQTPHWSKVIDDPDYICVSVEQNNLYPVHADTIRYRLKELENDK